MADRDDVIGNAFILAARSAASRRIPPRYHRRMDRSFDEETDVAIVGGGPIGIELAVALQRAGLSHIHFEAKQIGATMMWWAPGTRWFSSNERIAIAGVPLVTPDQGKCTREQYLAYLRQIVTMFDLPIRTYEPVKTVERDGNGFVVVSTDRANVTRRTRAKRVVLCTGGTDRCRMLGIPGETLPHVSAFFADPHTYFRRSLVIIGGRNSAVEAALRCYHAGAHITLSYRQSELPAKSIKYWLMPEMAGLMAEGKIAAHFNTTPVAITPAAVTLRRADGSTFDVPADFVLKLVGYEQDNELLVRCGLDLTGEDHIPAFDPATMETNVPGLYVAGTAVGGTQSHYKIFLENCHVHVERIVADLLGTKARAIEDVVMAEPES